MRIKAALSGDVARRMMMYHVRSIPDPRVQIGQARMR
jgi:hypothetical protein